MRPADSGRTASSKRVHGWRPWPSVRTAITDVGQKSRLPSGRWASRRRRRPRRLEPYVELRAPKLFNLRTDPYERADITSNTYFDWMIDRIWVFTPAQAYVAEQLKTLVEFPQRQKSASFNLEQVMAKLQAGVPDS
jgi:hypothetical protein